MGTVQVATVAGTSATYTYTGDGALASETKAGVTTRFTLDSAGGDRRLGATTGASNTWYPSGWGETLARDTGSLTWLLPDTRGSIRAEVPAGSATPATTLLYTPFGSPEGATTPADLGFAGAPHDAALGQVHLRARWLSPGTGRFLSRDPFAGSPASPQSLAPYAYAHNDPVGNIDPTGRCVAGVCDGWGPTLQYFPKPNSVNRWWAHPRDWPFKRDWQHDPPTRPWPTWPPERRDRDSFPNLPPPPPPPPGPGPGPGPCPGCLPGPNDNDSLNFGPGPGGGGGGGGGGLVDCVPTLDCTEAQLQTAPWNERIAWLEAVNRYWNLDGWFNNILGIIEYFRDSPGLKRNRIMEVTDGTVIWVIQEGLAENQHGRPPQPGSASMAIDYWGDFFDGLLRRDRLADSDLRKLWGRAEQPGVNASMTRAGYDPFHPRHLLSYEGILIHAFTRIGNEYRTKVTEDSSFGFWHPDPRLDRQKVYWLAIGIEACVYSGLLSAGTGFIPVLPTYGLALDTCAATAIGGHL